MRGGDLVDLTDVCMCGVMQAPAHGHLNYSKEFVAEARLAMLQKIDATPFNLVVSDYGWWTSMSMTRPGTTKLVNS